MDPQSISTGLQSFFTVAMGGVASFWSIGSSYLYLGPSTADFLFLMLGLFSVVFSCVSSLNNSLSIRVGAFFSWMAMFVITLLFLQGSSMIMWIALCLVMTVLHLLQIFTWTFSRARRING